MESKIMRLCSQKRRSKMAVEQKYEKVIHTPDETEAEYVYEDFAGNPVYFDGSEYWVIDRGEIAFYG